MTEYFLAFADIMQRQRKLSPEDQAKVDQFLNEGYNDVERREFRPGVLLLVLVVVLLMISGVAYLIALSVGVV